MKKLSYAIVAIFITASLSACSTSTAAEKEKKDETAVESGKSKVQEVAIHLTKEEFLTKVYNYEANSEEWVYEGDKPAIIDFYASWCPPCKIASPILEDLAKEYEGKIYVYKINTEEERELAAAFGISSIPTFMLIPMGERPQVFSGIGQTEEATREIFVKAIDEVLLNTQKVN
ncbi:MAG: thioredoxin [Bacteroidales bacterium]|nr:thioredoxin [Bacteroidales bacterium]